MAVDQWLPTSAGAHPGHPALETADATLSYAGLLDAARREPLPAGAGPVPIELPPGSAFAVRLHACLLAGRAAVPIDPRLPAAERARRRAVAAPPDAAIVVHTSGTTAHARPVGLTAANWEASAHASRAALGLSDDERWLLAMPLTHVGGLSIITRCAIFGWTAVVHERFETGEVARALDEDGITVVSLVPTMLARLLDAGLERPPDLACALVGGGPLSPALLERARAAGIPVAQTYGLTQACSQVTTQAPGDKDVTAGRPLPGTRVEIAPDGEVLVSGPTVAPGALGPDGRLHTGDLGRLDAEGRLTVTGRRADTIVTGGENVAPAEVEAALLAHPAVADAGVYGRPDPEWGEAVLAAVVPRPGAAVSPEELRAHCATRLAGYQVPKGIALVESLPRTPSGKLLRRELDRIGGPGPGLSSA